MIKPSLRSSTILMTVMIPALLFLQACASETGQAEKICNIVEADEIKNLMEGDYTQEPLSELPKGSEGCKFMGADQKTINYIIGTAENEEDTKQAYQKAVNIWMTGNIPNRQNKKIEDLGDEAFWAYNSTTPQMVTRNKKRLYIITLGHFKADEDTNLFRAKRICKLLMQNE